MRLNKGFILTARAEDINSKHYIFFYGISAHGPFEIIISTSRPLFFIEKEASLPGNMPPCQRKNVALKSFQSKPVDALYFNTHKDLQEGRDLFKQNGLRTFESDVRTPERFLMERFIYGSIEFFGDFEEKNGVLVYRDPKIKRSSYNPEFNILSLDIETSMGNDLYSIGLHQRGPKGEYKKVLMVADHYEEIDKELVYFPSEQEVLLELIEEMKKCDPDVIAGWHVIGFDLIFLERKFDEYGIDFKLGRSDSKVIIQEKKGIGHFAQIDGRVVIDGPPTLRNAFFSFSNFKLETVARELLGVGKDIDSDNSENKVAEIERRFREDKKSLAHYNILDCTLVLDIYKKVDLIELVKKRSQISGLLIDKIGISTAAFDHIMLPHIHRKGFVGPNIIDVQREGGASGGYVLEPEAGLHELVLVLDFKSLYPSIIRTFKIDPYSRVMASKDPVSNPAGVAFSATENILPKYVENMMSKRTEAKENGEEQLSMAIKILMNSFYGVMGSPSCRFYHVDLPRAITETGQWLLKTTIKYLSNKEYNVIYGDTDSVFVKIDPSDKARANEIGKRLSKEVNNYLFNLIKKEFGAESCFEFEFEKMYRKIFFPRSRSGEGAAKKRYVGLVVKEGKEKLDFVGMEYVRNDWTQMAKEFQYELFNKLFSDQSYEDWIKAYVKEVKEGLHDRKLIYKKRLTKAVHEYTKNVPPHVKAAKKLKEANKNPGKSITYVMTNQGPWPTELSYDKLDYEHYIERQIKPLADNVLNLFDKSFDDIVIGDQLALF
ncbi:MAG: DNA polymerase II [Bacteriovoracaceae bacterium]